MYSWFDVNRKRKRKKQGTRNKEQGTRNKEQGTRNKEQGTRNKEQGTRNKEQGTRNKEQGTRNKEQGTRNKEQGPRQGTTPMIHQKTKNRRQKLGTLFQAKKLTVRIAEFQHFAQSGFSTETKRSPIRARGRSTCAVMSTSLRV